MTRKNKLILSVFIAVDFVIAVIIFWQLFSHRLNIGEFLIFKPQGEIAHKELGLMVTAVMLMLVVVIPVFVLTAYFAWKYKAGKNPKSYSPNLQSNFRIGLGLWAIPTTVIFIIGILIWQSTHELDPYKDINSNVKPVIIEVVALNWKWLFIYPEEQIATVNYFYIPEKTPVKFKLTSDGPMSTFWIPQLGGQVYAMSGMQTELNLIANNVGEFFGSSTEINGKGFSGMKFKTKSVTKESYAQWVQTVKSLGGELNQKEYDYLVLPSENNPESSYAFIEKKLYNSIVMKYMPPTDSEVMNMNH